jgi:hypothetical protein
MARYGGCMANSSRGRWLTVAAVLFGILAISNALKPLGIGEQTGFVFFGQRQTGMANAILGPLFGLFLAVYAFGIWNLRQFALPMAWIYAGYVLINLVLFPFRTPAPPNAGIGHTIFGIVYAIVAIGVSVGTARVLAQRDDLV